MSKFDLKKIPTTGRLKFYQLTIDDKPDFSALKNDETEDDRKTGELDRYENGLQISYKKNMENIYNSIERVSNNQHVPGDKYHELRRPKKDDIKDYEFKSGDLRVYAIKTELGQVIIFGGFKNNQNDDINKMRSLKFQYLKSKNQTNEKK